MIMITIMLAEWNMFIMMSVFEMLDGLVDIDRGQDRGLGLWVRGFSDLFSSDILLRELHGNRVLKIEGIF